MGCTTSRGARCLLAAVLLAIAFPPRLIAEEQTLFGDVQAFAQDTFASTGQVLAASAGMNAGTQLLAARVMLDLHQRISFGGGQLTISDSASWWQGSDGGTLQNDLQQAYVALTPTPAVTLVLGKQRLSWGTGYAFSPGDRIDPPASPQNRSEGFFGLTAVVAPSASFSLTASVRFDTAFPGLAQLPGLAPSPAADLATALPFLAASLPSPLQNPWLGLRYALYADAFLGDLDLHAGATWQWREVLRPTAGFSVDILGFIIDGALAVELSGSGLYPDQAGVYTRPAFGTPFPIATVGLQRSESSDTASLTATVEYLYDGTGYDSRQASRFFDDFLAALAGAGTGATGAALDSAAGGAWVSTGEVIPSLGQHYAAISLSGGMTSVFTATMALVVNLQDLSFAVQPELRVTRLAGIDLFLRALAAWGRDDHTEFGILPLPLTVAAGAIVHF